MSKTLALQELPFTGERLVTDASEQHVQLIFEHIHRYLLAAECCQGKDVLDIACGEGYGTNILGALAASVVGVDISPQTIRHAGRKYRRKNIRFVTGTCFKIPLGDHSIDTVVSFETIEHIDAHEAFIAEIRRVLKPEGCLIISSPDKAEYSDRPGQQNPFHVRELYRPHFMALLRNNFKNCRFLRQRLVAGSYIAADTHPQAVKTIYGTYHGDFQGGVFAEGMDEGIYALAICSDGRLPTLRLGVFENRLQSAQIWHTYESARQRLDEAERLNAEIAGLRAGARERDELQRQLDSSRAIISELEKAVDDRTRLAASCEAELNSVKDRLAAAEAEVASLKETADERARMRAETDQLRQDLESARSASMAELSQAADERARLALEHDAEIKAAEADLAGVVAECKRLRAQLKALYAIEGGATDGPADDREILCRQLARTEENSRILEVQLSDAQKLTGSLLAQTQAQESQMSSLAAERDQIRSDLENTSRLKEKFEAKARRMQSSVSWKVTSPLRAIRRLFLDPPKAK